jgi:hypothetical protein
MNVKYAREIWIALVHTDVNNILKKSSEVLRKVSLIPLNRIAKAYSRIIMRKLAGILFYTVMRR